MPILYRLAFALVALACYIAAALLPEVPEVRAALIALGSGIVGAVLIRRPGDVSWGTPDPAPKPKHRSSSYPTVGIVLVLAGSILMGCAALRSVLDAHKDACDLLGEQHRAEIQAEADSAGVPFAKVWAAWRASCLLAHERAAMQAAGMAGSTLEAPPGE